jgi:hypothetical protein
MRIAVLIAASALLAGCSAVPAGKPGPTELTPITPSRSAGVATSAPGTVRSSASPTTRPSSTAAPAAGVPVAEAIAWVEAGPPADNADFRVALRGGTTTPLGDDTAFTTPSGTSCMTDGKRAAGGLACLVNLVNPPPQPPDVYGAWKGGWVDFDGSSVRVGSAHGDPGRFAAGQGAPLPPGSSVSFGDFRCRTDAATLVCVNYARKTGARYSDDGIDTYGCTRQSPTPAGVGEQYAC